MSHSKNTKHEYSLHIIRILLFLFSVSISVAVVPCGVGNTYGMLGEMYTLTAENDTIVTLKVQMDH